jgi:hemolysin III
MKAKRVRKAEQHGRDCAARHRAPDRAALHPEHDVLAETADMTRIYALPGYRDFMPDHRGYSRAELWVDGVLHSVAILTAIIGVAILLSIVALQRSGIELTTTILYSIGLIAMLGFSMAYNVAPPSRLKWLLRRFDHSAIYLMIAGTYTPLLAQLQDSATALVLGTIVWIGALAGIALKLAAPHRFDRISIGLYLGLGWVAVFASGSLVAALPLSAMILILVGGALYSLGVIFHVWRSLRFQNAIWHAFVIAAAACHYAAITVTLA